MPICPGLPHLGILLLNRPAIGLLANFSRPLMVSSSDENHHTALIKRELHAHLDTDTHENIPSLPTGSYVAAQCEDGGLGHMEQ